MVVYLQLPSTNTTHILWRYMQKNRLLLQRASPILMKTQTDSKSLALVRLNTLCEAFRSRQANKFPQSMCCLLFISGIMNVHLISRGHEQSTSFKLQGQGRRPLYKCVATSNLHCEGGTVPSNNNFPREKENLVQVS